VRSERETNSKAPRPEPVRPFGWLEMPKGTLLPLTSYLSLV
jgi:hypothetical protein